jgi:hypothetical protein
MAEETMTLQLLGELMRTLQRDISALRDEQLVQGAILRRIDGTMKRPDTSMTDGLIRHINRAHS